MVLVAPAASFHGQRTAAAASFHSQRTAAAAAADPGFGVDLDGAKSGNAIQFWHPQPIPPGPGSGEKKVLSMMEMDHGGGGSGGSGTAACHDCGNQAKKDCPHQRCRTCCKSSGFDCTTHVRSTWIPAARRRERHAGGGASSPPSAAAVSKKSRLLSSQTTTTTGTSSNGTTPRSFDTSSSQQDASFKDRLPRHVRAPAVFRCVRVTSIDDGEDDEFAYQASVSINGHVFRGFLYDQGADDEAAAMRSGISDLHLGSASAVPPSLYNAASGGFILGGLGYGNTMN